MPIPPVSKDDHMTGSVSAPITLIEYGDFECPDCGNAFPVVGKWQMELGEKLCFVFRHMPLDQMYPIHPHATHAALAAEAAGKQGKFWEMHDLMFQNQDALDDEDLISYAELLGLDEDQFAADMDDPAVMAKVLADFEAGKENGVTSTPGFFVNGSPVENSRDYAALEKRLQELGGD